MRGWMQSRGQMWYVTVVLGKWMRMGKDSYSSAQIVCDKHLFLLHALPQIILETLMFKSLAPTGPGHHQLRLPKQRTQHQSLSQRWLRYWKPDTLKIKLKPKKLYYSKNKCQLGINTTKTAYPNKNQKFFKRPVEPLTSDSSQFVGTDRILSRAPSTMLQSRFMERTYTKTKIVLG